MKPSKTKLAKNIKDLHTALNQANSIIETIETEQKRLKDVLVNLTSENKEDYEFVLEGDDEPVHTAIGY